MSFKNEAKTRKSRVRQIAYKGLESAKPEVGIFSDRTTKYFFFELVQLDNSEHGLKKVTARGTNKKRKKISALINFTWNFAVRKSEEST